MSFRFKKFKVYQDTKRFIKEIYQLARTFPKQEQFELASQLRRAAVSILLDIARVRVKNQTGILIDFFQ